jgi:hypothetical protein
MQRTESLRTVEAKILVAIVTVTEDTRAHMATAKLRVGYMPRY